MRRQRPRREERAQLPEIRRRAFRFSTSVPAIPKRPANSIPNILADLIETETWRNAATLLLGALLIGLGYWAYHGIRDSLAQTRAVGLEALLGTVVKGLDVWVGEHVTEAARVAKDPDVVARAAPRGGKARRCRSPRCTADAEELSQRIQSSLSSKGVVAFRIVDRSGLVLSSKDAADSGCDPVRFVSGLISRLTARRNSFVRIRKPSSRYVERPVKRVRWRGFWRRYASAKSRRLPPSRWGSKPIASSTRFFHVQARLQRPTRSPTTA